MLLPLFGKSKCFISCLTPSRFGLKKCFKEWERRSRRGRRDLPHTHALEMLANFAKFRTLLGQALPVHILSIYLWTSKKSKKAHFHKDKEHLVFQNYNLNRTSYTYLFGTRLIFFSNFSKYLIYKILFVAIFSSKFAIRQNFALHEEKSVWFFPCDEDNLIVLTIYITSSYLLKRRNRRFYFRRPLDLMYEINFACMQV